jgi:RNA polymerase sigma-70 factor, ECF subfamily
MADTRGEVAALLGELNLGHKDALARLMPPVYPELRRVAGRCMRDERPGHTEEVLAVDEILARLAELDPRQARTGKRDWAMAKAWMKTQPESGGSR